LSYTGQAPPLTNDEIESLLRENNTARICTYNKDGSIHAMPVSYRYLNGQIVFLSYAVSRKTRNIKRNNDVTVLIDNERSQGILIYGKAELEYDNAYEWALLVWERIFPAPRDKFERFVQAALEKVKMVTVKVTSKRMVSFDFTKDDVFNNLIKTYLQK